MIVALVLLAVAAGAGWSLAIALLTGGAIGLADRRTLSGNNVSGNPQVVEVHLERPRRRRPR